MRNLFLAPFMTLFFIACTVLLSGDIPNTYASDSQCSTCSGKPSEAVHFHYLRIKWTCSVGNHTWVEPSTLSSGNKGKCQWIHLDATNMDNTCAFHTPCPHCWQPKSDAVHYTWMTYNYNCPGERDENKWHHWTDTVLQYTPQQPRTGTCTMYHTQMYTKRCTDHP